MAWKYTLDDRVLVVEFVSEPPHTATYADLEQLEELLLRFADTAQVVVITGSTPDVFIAHTDLDDLIALRRGEPTSGDGSAWGRVLRLLDRGPLLSIAAINGRAWGGGTELALTCNLRFMAEGATLGFPEVGLGILPGVGAHRAIMLLPEHAAFEMLLGLEPLSSARAVRFGLVNGAVPHADLLPTVLDLAHRITRQPADAVVAVRDLVFRRGEAERQLQRDQLSSFMELMHSDQAGTLLQRAAERYHAGADPFTALAFGDNSEGLRHDDVR